MLNIAKRKLPLPILGILVYISYCGASWYVMRGNLAYVGHHYGMPDWFNNDIWAFFLGGLVPFLLYQFAVSFVYRALHFKTGGDLASIKYGLNFAVIAANLVLFGLKFIYLAYPLYAAAIDVILDPTVTVLMVGLYMWYAFYQNYIDKSKFRIVLMQVMGTFVSVYLLFAVFSILLSAA